MTSSEIHLCLDPFFRLLSTCLSKSSSILGFFSLKLQIFKSLGFVPYLGFSIRAPWPRAFDLILDLGFRQQRSNKRGTTQKSIFFSDPFPWLKLLVSNKLIFIMHIFLTIMTNIAFKSPKYGHFEAQYNCCYSTNWLWENNFSCWPKVLGCLYCLLQAQEQELKHAIAQGCWILCVCVSGLVSHSLHSILLIKDDAAWVAEGCKGRSHRCPLGSRSYFFTILIGEESIGPKLFEEARQSHLLFINNFASK